MRATNNVKFVATTENFDNNFHKTIDTAKNDIRTPLRNSNLSFEFNDRVVDPTNT